MGENVTCPACGGEMYVDHDCGEDCCCCADPEPNVPCDFCRGVGYVPETVAAIWESDDNAQP